MKSTGKAGKRRRTRSATSVPRMPGITMSVTTALTSFQTSSGSASAASPFSASITEYPSAVRVRATTALTPSSSSTISKVAPSPLAVASPSDEERASGSTTASGKRTSTSVPRPTSLVIETNP